MESPLLNAEILLSDMLGVSRVELYTRPISWNACRERGFRKRLALRARRVPLQYITGTVDFCGLPFAVVPGVFIPRPETEILVEEACSLLKDCLRRRGKRILEVGTGSGAVAVSLARRLPDARVTATEVSVCALSLARRNAARHEVGKRIRFLRAMLFPGAGYPRFDAIVSNPPYIPSEELDRLAPEVRREPRRALDGGPDGLSVVRRILRGASAYLRCGGYLLLETGAGHAEILRRERYPGLFYHHCVRDISGVERIAVFQAGGAQREEGESSGQLRRFKRSSSHLISGT